MDKKFLLASSLAYLMLFSAMAMPAAAQPRESVPMAAATSSFNLLGEYSPRSRCKDEAKRVWKRCRERDRRPNNACDYELERRRRECDRLPR